MCGVIAIFVIVWGVIEAARLPNFVFILTDDQDIALDSMLAMKNTRNLIADQGVTFVNSFVNTPICCPSRSTILTGFYAHNHKTTNNSLDGGCSSPFWQKTFEPKSIAALLKKYQNYTTFYAGKYLNQYGSKEAGGIEHVPPGYDWWIGLKGNSRYYNYTLSINGSAHFFSDKYLTDSLAEYVDDFLNQNWISNQSLFMMVAPPAPHAPFLPAVRHQKKFPEVKAIRTPSFNYSATDKHPLLQLPPNYLPSNVTQLDDIQRNRWRTLLAVDELVQKIVTKLESLQILNETYIIFSSDNGFHIGQFTQPWDKRQPYDTDIRVPFLVRGPKIQRKSYSDFPISAIDILPTIVDLANITNITSDGQSFKNVLLGNEVTAHNKIIFVEYWGEGGINVEDSCRFDDQQKEFYSVSRYLGWYSFECSQENWCKCQDSKNNTYGCVLEFITDSHIKSCKFIDGFIEAYNMKEDPYELNNIFRDLSVEQKKYYIDLIDTFQK